MELFLMLVEEILTGLHQLHVKHSLLLVNLQCKKLRELGVKKI